MMNNSCLAAAGDFLQKCSSLLILTHRRPDGDTIGSAAALCLALRGQGKTAFLAPNADITPRLAPFAEGLFAPEGFEPEGIIAVDVADLSMLPPAFEKYASRIGLCIDHHPSNPGYAALNLIGPSAAATGELIWQLFPPEEFSKEALTALYLAVSTDTGCFRYSNTTPQSHEIAAFCIAKGVDFHKINRDFFVTKTRARFKLERYLFDEMVFASGGRVGVVLLPRKVINSLGATDDDMDNLSTLITQVEGVMCGAVLTENREGGSYKVSVRTTGQVDACALCTLFGGGGHVRAAGCTISGKSAQQARDMIIQAAEQAVLAAEERDV